MLLVVLFGLLGDAGSLKKGLTGASTKMVVVLVTGGIARSGILWFCGTVGDIIARAVTAVD